MNPLTYFTENQQKKRKIKVSVVLGQNLGQIAAFLVLQQLCWWEKYFETPWCLIFYCWHLIPLWHKSWPFAIFPSQNYINKNFATHYIPNFFSLLYEFCWSYTIGVSLWFTFSFIFSIDTTIFINMFSFLALWIIWCWGLWLNKKNQISLNVFFRSPVYEPDHFNKLETRKESSSRNVDA